MRPCTSADWPRPKTPTIEPLVEDLFGRPPERFRGYEELLSIAHRRDGRLLRIERAQKRELQRKTAVFRPVMVEGHAHRAQLQRQRLHGSCGGAGCSPRCGRAEHAKSGIAIHDESLAHSRFFERPAMIFVMHSIRTPNFSRPFHAQCMRSRRQSTPPSATHGRRLSVISAFSSDGCRCSFERFGWRSARACCVESAGNARQQNAWTHFPEYYKEAA